MTTKTIKLIVFIAILVHGIGHFQGVVASLGVKINKSKPATSWLLKNAGEKVNKRISFVLFLLTGMFGIIAALSFRGLIFSVSMWEPMAIVTAIFSTICLVLFPNNFAMFFNKLGAVGVNLFIYYSVLFGQKWPEVLFDE